MPQGDRNSRYAASEDGEGDTYVAVKPNAGRIPRSTSKARTPKSSPAAAEDPPGDGYGEWLPMSVKSASSSRSLPSCISRSSWLAQAFQHTMSEGGMALMTAFILLLLSLAGFFTMYFVAPSHTANVLSGLTTLANSAGDDELRGEVSNIVPEALTLLQCGLQVMVVPAAIVGFAGVFVLGSVERRRPGCLLVSYGCAAVVLGLGLLYLLLRVSLGSSLSGVEESINSSLYKVWNAKDNEDGACEWERTFSCSGFHYCCVTNTTALADDAVGRESWAAWDSLCFVTLLDGTAITEDGADVTEMVQLQCGPMNVAHGEVGETLGTTTPCAVSATAATSTAARLSTCEDYVLGHLTATMGFALHLLVGMAVCSVVSGVVALLSYFQRTRTADFMLVNNPAAAAVSDNAMLAKERK